jgi:hypothetical protein
VPEHREQSGTPAGVRHDRASISGGVALTRSTTGYLPERLRRSDDWIFYSL